jgi:hypothetical protein
MKFSTPLCIPLNDRKVLVRIIFKLIADDIECDGRLVWSKSTDNAYHYGVEFVKESEGIIIKELKEYTKAILKDK